jgi:hypothetical protein
LGNVQLKNDIEGHKELLLAVGEEPLTPSSESKRRGLQLVVDDMNRLRVWGWRGPGFLDNFCEPWHLGPEGLEAKDRRLTRATLVGEKKRSMI